MLVLRDTKSGQPQDGRKFPGAQPPATLTSQRDCVVEVVCEGNCTGAEWVRMRNNIFQGQTDSLQTFEQTCFVWWENFPANPVNADYSIIYGVKSNS